VTNNGELFTAGAMTDGQLGTKFLEEFGGDDS